MQKNDEIETAKFGQHPIFVPFISINGKGHIHMQAVQTIMTEKVRSWNMTLSNIPARVINKTNCQLPPDFWCTDSTITNECFSTNGCTNYLKLIYGKPIHIRILYKTGADSWQKYFNKYLNPNLIKSNRNNRENKGKFLLEMEPFGNSIESNCNQKCQERIAFEVIFCLN